MIKEPYENKSITAEMVEDIFTGWWVELKMPVWDWLQFYRKSIN